MDRGRVAAVGVGVDDGELPAGDRGVKDDRELVAAGIGKPLVLASLKTASRIAARPAGRRGRAAAVGECLAHVGDRAAHAYPDGFDPAVLEVCQALVSVKTAAW